ncbi:MAG: sigma-70 family RNA polymerase sigma factor [Candidatus Omnitrophota bacterium]|nr:sigma-70 family RNA polymerase sigma factor [Candidatus Omnitrophota bacterium]
MSFPTHSNRGAADVFFSSPQDPQRNYLSDPDVLLMSAFQKGDPASFETLMRKYYARVLNFIYRFVGSKEIAEDLTQEVFLRVYKTAPSYKPQAKFQTWLYTIAKNLSLNELRRNRHRTFSMDEEIAGSDGELRRQFEDHSIPRPDAALVKEDAAKAVKEAINALPENQRLAVILRRYEDFSYEEIARTMNCSVKAVKSLLNRAKENLRNALGKYVQGKQ